MESRLPKPKINFLNSLNSFTSRSMKMGDEKASNSTDLPTTSSSSVSESLKKAKSTLNLNSKCTNENKPPPRPNLRRSRTMSSITTRAVKRPAAITTVHGEVKKPFTRPVVKPRVQPSGTLASTSTSTTRPVPNTAVRRVQSTNTAKPSKWDLKGRLAQSNDALSDVRQKYKETTSKCNELETQVSTLETHSKIYKSQAEKYENLNKALDCELNQLKAEVSSIQDEREDLANRLKESEASFKTVTDALKKFKEKCASQEALLSEHASEMEGLRASLESEQKMNKELRMISDELQSLVHTMDKDRRTLHNAIQELKGNIRVFCRVRPQTPNELGKPTCSMNFTDECTIEIGKSDGSDSVSCSGKVRGTRQEFSFDKVFPPTARQIDIFEELALLVQSALEGYNVCVFAYGQTGSGKTYTMEGLPGIETEGMIPKTVQHIFQEMREFELLGWEYRIEASFLEIYNEHIVDLLDSQLKTHEIRMADSKGQDLYVSNLKIEEIHSPEELHQCLLTAQKNRAVAATQSNERSSRSHSVTRIKLIGVHKMKEEVSIGNLNLVDLAGSERLRGEESVRVAETKNINKSLANLGNVILALLKKQEHIPYRNSKLTHLLMPSLGGNSKTLMLLNISPLDECYNETLNSLRFASNVNSCKTGNIKRTRTVLQNAS
ncbi:protein claret segregational [Andrena cerasifolii]|uniref:protein claret segregational n=1 Tax=Andrena cerasifolii TaxID=2819439 RepID=UPI0040377777